MKKSKISIATMISYKKYFLLGLLSLSSSTVLAADLSTYNQKSGLLTVQDYDGGNNQHYYLQFSYKGNSNFLLTDAKPLTAPSGFQQPAYFNETANVVTIPSVNAGQQYYSVDLRYMGGYSFTLARADQAQPPTINTPNRECQTSDITRAKVIQVVRGLTLDQVNNIMGCSGYQGKIDAFSIIYDWRDVQNWSALTARLTASFNRDTGQLEWFTSYTPR